MINLKTRYIEKEFPYTLQICIGNKYLVAPTTGSWIFNARSFWVSLQSPFLFVFEAYRVRGKRLSQVIRLISYKTTVNLNILRCIKDYYTYKDNVASPKPWCIHKLNHSQQFNDRFPCALCHVFTELLEILHTSTTYQFDFQGCCTVSLQFY